MDEAAESERRRLRWRCRRGMKELDLLLLRYLDERWANAPQGERHVFGAFLELPDPLMAAYLLGHADPPDPALAALLGRLRPPLVPAQSTTRSGAAGA